MIETSRIWLIAPLALAAACVAPPEVAQQPAPPAAPVVAVAPPAPPSPALEAAAAEEARALLAQAETDVSRARSRRALWQRAWEDLVAARQAVAANQHGSAARYARNASDLARLGLEQLAYPAVK